MSWSYIMAKGELHIAPYGDCAKHWLDAYCPCMPAREWYSENIQEAADDRGAYLHNAWDGRERYEWEQRRDLNRTVEAWPITTVFDTAL